MSVTARLTDDRGRAIQKAWVQFGLVSAGVGTVLLTVCIALSPSLYAMIVEHVVLSQYETDFGFRGGRISISGRDKSYARYGILEVTPGGILDVAGVRAGDIPIDYHGGVVPFYSALCDATQGKEAAFVVVSRDDPSWEKSRSIELPR